MPRQALKPSPTLAKLLRKRREELGLTAREVEARTKQQGERVPFATLLRIEDARQEPGVRRLYALFRLYELPLESLPDLLELEARSASLPREKDPELLLRRGIEHWKRGETGPALAHLFALRMQAPSGAANRQRRHEALLSFAIAANGVGKTRLSLRIIEELLVEGPVPKIRFETLMQASVTWLNLGSIDVATALLDRAAAVTKAPTQRQLGFLAHHRAKILLAAGHSAPALKAVNEALRAYQKADDSWNASKVREVRFSCLLALGRARDALREASRAFADAVAQGHAMLALHRRLNEGKALLALSRPKEALERFDDALRRAHDLKDADGEFYAHFYLSKAHTALGDDERARLEVAMARYHLRSVDHASPECQEIRSLDEGAVENVERFP